MSAGVDGAKFSSALFLAFFASIAGLVAEIVIKMPVALAVNLITIFVLSATAVRYIRSRATGFDHVVAAESIVAFGVFALVTGVGAVITLFFVGMLNIQQFANGEFTRLYPFVEGLVTAGCAPICAIWVRSVAAESELPDAVGDTTGLAAAMGALTSQIMAAKTAMDGFAGGAAKASASTHGLADTVRTETDKWSLAVVESQAHLKSFGEAARFGSGEVSSLAAESAKLKKAVSDTSTMLEELGRLIDAIERFVGPRATKP